MNEMINSGTLRTKTESPIGMTGRMWLSIVETPVSPP